MIKKICIVTLILLYSCKEVKPEQKETIKIDSTSKEQYTSEENIVIDYKKSTITNWFKTFKTDTIIASEMYWKEIIEKDSLFKIFKTDFIKSPPLKDKTITFLWTEENYQSLINQDYCKTMSEPERAALAFVAMDALSNSKLNKTRKECTIESAMNLDYSCSDKDTFYLKLWFCNDLSSLIEIENCHAQSNMSSAQSHFDKITLIVKANKIYIDFKITGFSRDIWDSVETRKAVFLVNKGNIKLIERKKSEPTYVYYYPNDSNIEPPDGYKNNGKGEYRLLKKTKKK